MALIFVGGFRAADVSPVHGHEHQMQASSLDGHAAPCKTAGDHKAHPGCLSGSACVFLSPVEASLPTLKVATGLPLGLASSLLGGDVTPLFHPPKLSAAI